MKESWMTRRIRIRPMGWLAIASATVLAGACSSGPPGTFGGGSGAPNPSTSSSGSSDSNGSGSGSSGTGSSTQGGGGASSSTPDDDGGNANGSPPSTSTGDDDASATTTPALPTLSFPDAGFGTSTPASSGDGGANMCTTKICVDPVFDCPLQGCFNGCTNFHCD
jgi:hypothetical protein